MSVYHNTLFHERVPKTADEFKVLRRRLSKTQREMAQLLGTSIKAIHSYEQGWRTIPPHAERQMLFLVSRKSTRKVVPCWKVKRCPSDLRSHCPASEFKASQICWFINGTICDGEAMPNWREKMAKCRSCEVFNHLFGSEIKDGSQ